MNKKNKELLTKAFGIEEPILVSNFDDFFDQYRDVITDFETDRIDGKDLTPYMPDTYVFVYEGTQGGVHFKIKNTCVGYESKAELELIYEV